MLSYGWFARSAVSPEEVRMESPPDPQQARAVFDFMMFLGDTLSRSMQRFEVQTTCSPAEVDVLRVLAQRGPLAVKEIARSIPGLSLSKLTRVLDELESAERVSAHTQSPGSSQLPGDTDRTRAASDRRIPAGSRIDRTKHAYGVDTGRAPHAGRTLHQDPGQRPGRGGAGRCGPTAGEPIIGAPKRVLHLLPCSERR